jgi:hypothetical protein
MAVVDHLLSPGSALLSPEPWSPPDIVYLSMFDMIYLTWTMKAADKAYVALAAVVLPVLLFNAPGWKHSIVALFGTPVGLIAGLLSANGVAGLMVTLGKGLAW